MNASPRLLPHRRSALIAVGIAVFALAVAGQRTRGDQSESTTADPNPAAFRPSAVSAAGSPIRALADDYLVLYQSPAPATVYCGNPGITRCPTGRLVALYTLGGPGAKAAADIAKSGNGFVLTSDDHGATWTARKQFAISHARPFVAGKSLYVLGHRGDLKIMRSDDWGETWSETLELTSGQRWHQAPSNVHYAGNNIYLVMERVVHDIQAWPPSVMAPVLMRARVTDDLTQRSNWTFASELVFRDAVKEDALDYFGIPFFKADRNKGLILTRGRKVAPIGWCETNVVQILDPDHYWFDPTGRTFHLFMRAHTGGTNFAALAKVIENDDGTMTTQLEKMPSGRSAAFIPLPGGQLKFHILYDEQTRLYWLVSSQSTDSMTRADRLPKDRFAIPNQERHRLQLHFSKNCVDWVFAGLVTTGKSPKQARNYASMVIDGEDLLVLSRSGDADAKSAHDADMITLHKIRDFRRLAY